MQSAHLRAIGLEPALAFCAPPILLGKQTFSGGREAALQEVQQFDNTTVGPCWWELSNAESVEKSADDELQDPHRLKLMYRPAPDGYLSSRVTVVIFTSPVPSNPSTEMIAAVIESLKLIPGLPDCRLLVVCDGPGEITSGSCRPKKGSLTAAMAVNYAEYTARLQRQLGSEQVLRLPSRYGFGHAVQESLKHVSTRFVVFIQHDNMFVRPVDLKGVVQLMELHTEVLKCVHFVSPKTSGGNCDDAVKRTQGRLGDIAGPITELWQSDVSMKFLPMPSWLERNHICFTDHYRNCVFGPDAPRIRPGEFIEETFGQSMKREILKNGPPAHKRFGVFRLLDAPNPVTLHLDGRCFIPAAECIRRGWRASDLFEKLQKSQYDSLHGDKEMQAVGFHRWKKC